MIGLLIDRLIKKSDDKSKDERNDSSLSSPKQNYPGHSNLNPINGTPTNFNQSQHHPSKIPTMTSTSPEIYRVGIDQRKLKNPSPIHSKKLNDDQETLADLSIRRGTKENILETPKFGFKDNDKDSILYHPGSILESTKEGSFLAQIVPNSRFLTSKFGAGEKISASYMAPQTKNMFVGESVDSKDVRINEQVRNNKDKNEHQLQRAWQDWWSEKKKNNELLLEASKFGRLDVCRQLLDRNKGDLRADVNFKAENGWTPLHFGCLVGNIDLVSFLLSNEANINAETTLQFKAIHIASQKGHIATVQLLLNSGADINCKDIFNNTPLHYASQNGHKEIVTIFLSKPGVEFRARNNDNKLAYELAANKEVKEAFEAIAVENNPLSLHSVSTMPSRNLRTYNTIKIMAIENNNAHNFEENPAFKPTEGYKVGFKDESDFEEKRTSSHRSNTAGETKANTSLNVTDIDNVNVPMEEEKVGPHCFKVHGMIGKGSFGEVYLVEKKNTSVRYAMKVLHKSTIKKHNLITYAMTERNVLGITNHSFIVKLNYAFQTPEKLFLILDYCPGGDLGEHLHREKRFSEEKARFYLAEVLLALEDLHKRDIIFRDLKPDNIVIDAEGHAKLTDFGLSKEGVLDHTDGARSFCGSVAYLAPEMLKRVGHGKAVDWYLLGVVLYEMLVGTPPYYTSDREQLFYNIEKAPLKVPSHLTAEAKSLLKGLLQRDPTKRLGSGKGDAEEIKSHEFFKGLNWKEVEQRKIKPPILVKKINPITKVAHDVFDVNQNTPEYKGKINGWSFVAPNQQG